MAVVRCWPIVLGLILTACAQKDAGDDRIRVVVSILPQVEFVKRIGGDRVRVSAMVPPGASPPTYEPTPGQLAGVSRAAIYARVGAGLLFETVWMDRILATNERILVVDCSEGVELIPNDPHIWLSPRNARIMAENVYRGIAQVDPDHRDTYAENLRKYQAELDELDGEIVRSLRDRDNRSFLVHHPAWAYFAKDYDLEQIPVEEEGKEPTPRRMAGLVKLAVDKGIRTVFASPQFRTREAEVIANEIGAKVVLVSPLEEHYLDNLRRAAQALAER